MSISVSIISHSCMMFKITMVFQQHQAKVRVALSGVDYCNTVLVGSPMSTTDRLQRVLNAATCVVSGTGKFDHGLTQLRHSELHWLVVPERIKYKLGVTIYRCL